MKMLFKKRVNIFDKIAFGISFIPSLFILTLFTYYFNEGLVINGTDISEQGMFFIIKNLLGKFFSNISVFQLLVLILLLSYQLYFIFNVFITKKDGRKKNKTHDFGLFILSCLLCIFVVLYVGFFVITIWDFEWLTAWFIGLFMEYQPLASLFAIIVILAFVNVIYNGQYILTKGMKKYLKQCESCDYKFTYKEMILGLVNLGIVLFLCVIVSYRILMLMI